MNWLDQNKMSPKVINFSLVIHSREEREMLKEFEMGLLRRQFKEYLGASKKRKTQIITQYCELKVVSKSYLFKDERQKRKN